jgi:hypothetical protein
MQDIKLRSVSFRCYTLIYFFLLSLPIFPYTFCSSHTTSSSVELRHFWVCCNKDSLCLQDGAAISRYDVAATRMASIVAKHEPDIMKIQTTLTSAQKSGISFWRPLLTCCWWQLRLFCTKLVTSSSRNCDLVWSCACLHGWDIWMRITQKSNVLN